jgi:hypothetical protein
MQTRIDEIAAGIYRLSVYVPDIAPPVGFTFNHFLVRADEPMLFHCGLRAMFPTLSEAVGRLIPIETLRWIGFGHVEADECGAMNEWLGVAPRAQVVHGATACMVSVNDLADRAPRTLTDGEVVDLGGRRVRYIDTPHVPHGWEAGVLYEETTATLFVRRPVHPSRQRRGRHRQGYRGVRGGGGTAVSLHQPRAINRTEHPQARRTRSAHAGGDAWRLVSRQRRPRAACPCRSL